MAHHRLLPSHLKGTSFHVSERAFHELTPAQLRSSAVDAPFHGVRSLDLRITDAVDRARMYAPRLRPGQLFSHLTAAQLSGIPLPFALQRSTTVHIASLDGAAVRCVGVAGHRLKAATPHSVLELTIVSPAETWCHLAASLTREELVAAGDFLISGTRKTGGDRTPPLCTIESLAEAVHRFGRGRGAAALRWALARVRTGVDSPRESALRLAIMAAGLPEPIIGFPVTVLDGAVLHPDLSYPHIKRAIEYEGDEHRSNKSRWRSDLRRVNLLEQVGWRTTRVTDDDLIDPTVLIRTLRAALGLDHP